MFQHFHKISNFSQTYPKWSQKVPTAFPNMSAQIRKMSERSPKQIKILQTSPKHTITNHFRPWPEWNPVPSGSDSRTGSAPQPIGLIPSQQIGSPRISYVSKLKTTTHRNNLLAEKVTWACSKLENTLF